MSKRNRKNSEFNDSTTDFFLKIVKKEQATSKKESTSKDSFELKTTKTINRASKIYNYINKAFDKLLSNNKNVLVISGILTLVLFFTISGGDFLSSPTSGATLENVPVNVVGLDDDYEITGLPESITVGLIGPSLDIYSTRIANDYEVYLDVTSYTTGDYTVNLKSRNFPESLNVMLVPNSLKISIVKKIESTFKLDYQFINEDELDTQYSVTLDEIAVKNVTIRAAKDTLSKIVNVKACIDVADRTTDFEDDAKIKAYDENGNEVDVEISPSTVHVKCSVSSYSKTVSVKPKFIGNVADGYVLANYTLSYSTIEIYGTEENLKDISEVSCEIDISDLKSSTSISKIPIEKDEKISKLSSDSVDVTLEIEKSITKKFDKIPIKVLNKPSGKKVSFVGDSNYATVSVTGAQSLVNSLTNDNIQASIDVNVLDVGNQKVKVSVAIDNDLYIELLSSKEISINIERN